MKKHLSSISICFAPVTGQSCTTFVLYNSGQPIYGKSYDWFHVPSFVIVNKRGVAKTAIPFPQEPDAKQISWTSKFGNVTFSTFGRELPFDGINEAGLFVSSMGLVGIKYPPPDSRPPIDPLQWVQYQLDNFSTVDEVIASDKNMRIRVPDFLHWEQDSGGLHYLVSDSKGNCASIELLGGKMVCHTGENLPFKVLTNNTYDKSLSYLGRYKGYGGFLPISLSKLLINFALTPLQNSLSRFACAADMIQKFNSQTSGPVVDYAFNILSSVKQPRLSVVPTQWNAVYDSANKQIHFYSRNNDRIRSFNLSAFDFSCTTPVKVLDINADLSGDVTNSFVDYTKEIDLKMLKGAIVAPRGARKLPEATIAYLAAYPETTVCTEK